MVVVGAQWPQTQTPKLTFVPESHFPHLKYCVTLLLLCKNDHKQQLKVTSPLLLFVISADQESGRRLAGSSAQGLPRLQAMCQLGLRAHQWLDCGEIWFQDHLGYWKKSFSCGCRTETLFSCWGLSQFLEAACTSCHVVLLEHGDYFPIASKGLSLSSLLIWHLM